MKTTAGISRLRLRLMKILDATIGFWLCWILGYCHYLRNHGSAIPPNSTPKSILVIRPGGMGDMILLLPILKYLTGRFPSAQLDIVCEKRNIDILRLAGFEKNAIAYDTGILRVLSMLRSRHYDVAIDTEQFHNSSAIIAFLSRAAVRIGFKINPHRNLLYTHLVNYDLDGYEGTQFARLLSPLGAGNFSYNLEGCLSTGETAITSGQKKPDDPTKEDRLVTIHPGSTSVYKQWNVAKFAKLAHSLATERNLKVTLIGGSSDIDQANEIVRETGGSGKVASSAGQLTLHETAEIIRKSGLFISGDSGLAHLAIAVGTPTVVIFGPTDPGKWGLINSRHGIVRKSLACSPCFIFGYHKLCRSIECMADISPEEVLAACDILLNQTTE